MKKFFLLVALILISGANAQMFQSVPLAKAKLLQSGKEARYCANCGMDLVMFYRTSHAAKVNGKQKQFCSIHCLAEGVKNAESVNDIKVVDAKSLKWIEAKKAYYVVGSSVRGTMTQVSKYAFKNISDAKEFQHLKGGKIVDFDKAFAMAKKEIKN